VRLAAVRPQRGYNPQAAVSWMTRVNFGSVAKWNADNFRWYGESPS